MENELSRHDWQLGKKKISERSEHLLKSEQWSDCAFIVGSEPNQKIYNAHKMFLAMSSPVFEAMFYGGMAESEKPIPILDVQPEAFRALLEYVYTDSINIKTFDQACEVCYAAKKYMLPDLVEQCTQRIFQDLFASNACKAYEFAKLFEEPVLMERSLQLLLNETEAALADQSFEDVELATLLLILDSETLNISSERDLFNAVHRWAIKECGRKGLPEDSGNMRRVIGPALEKIHFLTLTPLQFAEGPALAPLLTRDESFSILMNISNPTNPGSKFPMPAGFSKVVEPRQRYRLPVVAGDPVPLSGPAGDTIREGHKFYCVRNVGPVIPTLNTGHMDCNLSFSVDRNICVLGIQVPTQALEVVEPRLSMAMGSMMGRPAPCSSASYTELLYAHLLDSDNSRLTYTHYTSRVWFGQLIEINFNRPVYIQRNKMYKIVVVTNKPGWYPLGTVTQTVMHCNAVSFNFHESVRSDPETSRESLVRSIIFSY